MATSVTKNRKFDKNITLKFGSNWHITGFVLIIFTFFCQLVVAAMFDGG
jgi:hypothetical protein